MTADKLVAAIRTGKDKFRLDQMELKTSDATLTGRGMLSIEAGKLNVRMLLDEGGAAPRRRGPGPVTVEEFWRLSGVIEDNLPFWCYFGPGLNHASANGFSTLYRDVGQIHVGKSLWRHPKPLPTGPDDEDRIFGPFAEETSLETLKALLRVGEKKAAVGDSAPAKSVITYEFQAWIADYELRTTNAGSKVTHTNDYLGEVGGGDFGTTLMGETTSYTFAFIQIEADGRKDLLVVLRPKDGYGSEGEPADLQRLQALLQALSLVHGKNAWPYRIKYYRDHVLTETVSAIRALSHTPHSPFSGMGHGAPLASLIADVATRFEDRSPFTRKLTFLLFLSRQAGDAGVQHEIGTLGICSVFDGLIDLLFEHLALKIGTDESAPSFKDVQGKLLARLDAWPVADKGVNYKRFRAMIQAANAVTPREKLKAICAHMGLTWEGGMKEVCEIWQKARNPLAHGKFKNDDDAQGYKDLTLAESRIAGGLNTLVLKLFGYSGSYNASVFEPGFARLGAD